MTINDQIKISFEKNLHESLKMFAILLFKKTNFDVILIGRKCIYRLKIILIKQQNLMGILNNHTVKHLIFFYTSKTTISDDASNKFTNNSFLLSKNVINVKT